MMYFTIDELCNSTTAKARNIKNIPNEQQVKNLIALTENVLDPLRIAYGHSIRVNSGYRCPELNAAVGGSKTSDHMNGCAADITAGSKCENEKLFKLIQELELPFDQLIDESNFSWVHVSFREGNNRGQIKKM